MPPGRPPMFRPASRQPAGSFQHELLLVELARHKKTPPAFFYINPKLFPKTLKSHPIENTKTSRNGHTFLVLRKDAPPGRRYPRL